MMQKSHHNTLDSHPKFKGLMLKQGPHAHGNLAWELCEGTISQLFKNIGYYKRALPCMG